MMLGLDRGLVMLVFFDAARADVDVNAAVATPPERMPRLETSNP
jgi:hypothetical protein